MLFDSFSWLIRYCPSILDDKDDYPVSEMNNEYLAAYTVGTSSVAACQKWCMYNVSDRVKLVFAVDTDAAELQSPSACRIWS